MPDVLLEAPIQAPTDRVYAAITEQSGLSSWWTPDVTAEPRVGSTGEFRFRGGAFVVKMEITELDPNRGVRWNVKQGSPEWAGTDVSWQLIPMEGGTRVRFGHHNYQSVEGSFANVAFNWAYYLNSLKDYLETGHGRPGGLHA